MTFPAIPAALALILSASVVHAAAPAKPAPEKAIPAKAKPAKAAAKSAKPAPIEPPLTVDGLLAQARDAVTRGETNRAVLLTQAAIVQNPARTGSYVALGNIYAAAGQPDFARNFYDQALGIDPADAGALKARAALDRDHPETTARNSK